MTAFFLILQTVRRVYEDPQYLADQIWVPVEIVERIKTTWIALTSGLPISPEKFGQFGKETKKMFVTAVPWKQLTPTVHKPMDHGKLLLEIIPPTLTPGMLSEEPAEASNKFYKVRCFQSNLL